MSKFSQWRKIFSSGIGKLSGTKEIKNRQRQEISPEDLLTEPRELLKRLRAFLVSPDAPNAPLTPNWLAAKLETGKFEMLNALAYAIRDGIVELHWEVFCPACGASPASLGTLREAHSEMSCPACGNVFDLHLDKDVRVTFSASEQIRRIRGNSSPPVLKTEEQLPTSGLDLLLVPSFRKLFSNEAPALNESLRIGRVAILFTDLRGSTAIYATRGDPRAYKMVREHFDILTVAIENNRGALVKTIGDAVMASFASGAEAVCAAFAAHAALQARIEQIGGELVLKAGVHAGTCLAVNLNGQLDFFGGAVNTAARVQGLSDGNDVVVTDEVFAELESSVQPVNVIESFDSDLRGLPDAVLVHRLVAH